MKKIFLVLILVLVCGCTNNPIKESVEKEIKEPTEQAIETINSASEATRKRNAELIIKEVELAYTRAMYSNMGDNPTLEDIKSNFSMNNAVWENDKIIYGDFECSVYADNDMLRVKCLDQELRGEYRVR